MENKVVNFALPLEQVNVIMAALGEAPFRVAQPVIQAIQEQVQPQLQPPAPANDNEDD